MLKTDDESVTDYCTSEGIGFKFNPAHAPDFGCIWEVGVKSAKCLIKGVIALDKNPIKLFADTRPTRPTWRPANVSKSFPSTELPAGDTRQTLPYTRPRSPLRTEGHGPSGSLQPLPPDGSGVKRVSRRDAALSSLINFAFRGRSAGGAPAANLV
ncbi:hypothetical protein EVAR_58961_1 [Eumeta japonica]|uniref:Uncharacterized protein n=1 Tax=Eumeta variegata TaxID=151549 RepID=A0A4C1YK38_EUMVA|nr:hypothetical protein EVAR_58961_1 [Eumeta japonica]